MLPSHSIDNPICCALGDSKQFSDASSAEIGCGVQSPDFNNIALGQNRTRLLFANKASSLLNHVVRIISRCSEPEMGRVATRRGVSARAIMENAKALWNRPVVNQPRGYMRCNGAITSCATHKPIPLSVFTRSPNPARVCLLNLGPEAVQKRRVDSLRAQNWIWVKRYRFINSALVLGRLACNRVHVRRFAPYGLLALRRTSILFQ